MPGEELQRVTTSKQKLLRGSKTLCQRGKDLLSKVLQETSSDEDVQVFKEHALGCPTCQQAPCSLAPSYVDEELTKEEADAFEEHLGGCPDCQELVPVLITKAALADWGSDEWFEDGSGLTRRAVDLSGDVQEH